MSNVTLGGNAIEVAGKFPQAGDKAPAFSLVGKDLKDVTLADFAGKRKVLNIVPSLDTPVCQASARKFNEAASGLANVVTLSTMRGAEFKGNYGVDIKTGPLAGVTARAVVVLDENDTVKYSQLVPEIKTEPDYDAALAALK